jgi:hypothetical protein
MCRSDSDGIGIGQRKNQRRQAELANHGISGPFFESGLRQKITQFKLTSFAPRVLPHEFCPDEFCPIRTSAFFTQKGQ